MYKVNYKFNSRDKSHEFATYEAFEDFFDSVPPTEQKHILNNCDLLHQAINQDGEPGLKNLLIIGFDPYMENEERETPVELSIKIGKKHLLVDLCKLITSEDRKLWTQKKEARKGFIASFPVTADSHTITLASTATVAATVAAIDSTAEAHGSSHHIHRMNALSLSESWADRVSERQQNRQGQRNCCAVM